MKPKTIRQDQNLLFQARLSEQLNPEHELLKLSKAIPWDQLEVGIFRTLFEWSRTAPDFRPFSNRIDDFATHVQCLG